MKGKALFKHLSGMDPLAPSIPLLRRMVGLLFILLGVVSYIAWEVHGIKIAVSAMEEEVPSQTTRVPITVNGTPTTTEVTTTFQESPHQSETQAEWDERHIGECERIRVAWENSGGS